MLQTDERRLVRRGRRLRTVTGLGAVLLAGSVAISGCGSAGDSASGASSLQAEKGTAADGGMARPDAATRQKAKTSDGSTASDSSGAADAARAAQRHVIRTARLTVETEDVQDGLDEARTAVTTAGGFVAQETTDRDADGEERSRVTFKVPPEEYQGVLDTLAGIGELVQRQASAKDVTGEVVDVESRIKTQQASVARIRELMDDATALSDVVTLESELSSRQADLEALQARLKSLESRSGMATVTLELRTPHAAPVEDGDDTTVGDAVSGGWDAFVTMLKWIAIGIGAGAPFVAALVALYGVWRGLRRFVPSVPRRAVAPPAPVTAPPPVQRDAE